MHKKEIPPIETLLSMDIDSLYELLGDELTPSGAGIFEPSKKQLITKGRLWIENNLEKIADKLCKDEDIRELFNNEDKIDKVQYISALVDLLGAFTIGISPVLLAVILLKYNISKVCEECWKQ